MLCSFYVFKFFAPAKLFLWFYRFFMFSMSNSVLSSISTHVLDINASVDQTNFVFLGIFLSLQMAVSST